MSAFDDDKELASKILMAVFCGAAIGMVINYFIGCAPNPENRYGKEIHRKAGLHHALYSDSVQGTCGVSSDVPRMQQLWQAPANNR